MIGLAIDALVLMVLLKLMNDDEGGFLTALLLALGASVVAYVVAIGLAGVTGGIVALLIAGLVTGALLGVCIAAIYGMEIKRAFLIAGIFIAVHIGFGLAFSLMLNA